MPSPYDNTGHEEMATYRHPSGWRITLNRDGWSSPKERPWQVVHNGNVTTRCGAVAIQAMRLAGYPEPTDWEYTP